MQALSSLVRIYEIGYLLPQIIPFVEVNGEFEMKRCRSLLFVCLKKSWNYIVTKW